MLMAEPTITGATEMRQCLVCSISRTCSRTGGPLPVADADPKAYGGERAFCQGPGLQALNGHRQHPPPSQA